ncbi:MAG: hypothetical protein E7211_21045 [Clostridium lundense]|nr:hypothetical protein [Clostridium lundense]
MNRSNINIQSNIYVLENELRNDWSFLRQVRSSKALEYLVKFNIIPTTAFSEVQKNIYSNQKKCVWADNEDLSFGVVKQDNKFQWKCRCEKTDCHRYKSCRADAYYNKPLKEKSEENIEVVVKREIAVTVEESKSKADMLPQEQEVQKISEIAQEERVEKIISNKLPRVESETPDFIDVFEEAQPLEMLYKLSQSEVTNLTGRKNKILIITKTKEDLIEASKYLYISGILHYLVSQDEECIAEQGINWVPDHETRNSRQVHIASLEELHMLEEEYVGIVFTFKEPEVIEKLNELRIQRLYRLCNRANQIYISLLREYIHQERLEIEDRHINWRAFNIAQYQELLGCVEQGETISIKRMDFKESLYYICYMDMPIGEIQPIFVEELKKLWEKVYNKELKDDVYLPMELGGFFIRECVSCGDGNQMWKAIRLQGYVEIESRYS